MLWFRPRPRIRFWLLALVVLLPPLVPRPLRAAAEVQARSASIRGTVVTAADGMRLSGVVIRLVPATRGAQPRVAVSRPDGSFVVADLPPGRYQLIAALPGFEELVQPVEVRVDETSTIQLSLVLAPLREEVSVQASSVRAEDHVLALATIPARLADVAPLAGDDFASLLPVLPGVIREPDGRLSLHGGRPVESGLQVSDANVTDPVTGNYGIELPLDAVESITRFTSPYAAEYGRFSSGVVRIETRRSDNEWRASMTNVLPAPRLRGGQLRGLSSFSPRLLVGGPVVRNRLFLTQSFEYEMRKTRVPSLPDGENDRELERGASFTRVDASFGDRHSLTATVALFPRNRRFVTLDTFTPRSVAPEVRERGVEIDLTHSAVVGPDLLVSSQVAVRRYDVSVVPGGERDRVMTITPAGRAGTYFHGEARESRSYQWIQSISRSVSGPGGEHLVKAGFDILHASYHGTTDNGAIEIRGTDGGLLERIAFPGIANLSASGTDVAVFLQDRWRVNDRLLIELGVRLDRDGVIRRSQLSPRAGVTVGVLPRGILRGGMGVFLRRSPLNIATFEQLEPRVVTRFQAGEPAPPETFVHQSRIGETPRAFVWSIGYDYRLSSRSIARVAHLRRRSRNEFVVDPVTGSGGPAIGLFSDGESDYKETEITVAYDGVRGLEAVASYVNARADGDFNHVDRFVGDVPEPILRDNARGLFDVDVPHRLVLRAVWPLAGGRWQLAPLVEIRSGFPYSAVDQGWNFVGQPNGAGRFPAVATVDLAVHRLLTIKGRRIRVGVRAYNLFNRFTPRDVQTNLASGTFGAFYNGIERRISFSLQLNPPPDR